MDSSSSQPRKVVLPGQPLAFHTECVPCDCPPGQALRFVTKCRTPAMPMATSITADKAPAAQ